MTPLQQSATIALQTLVGITGGWLVLAWYYRSYRIDLFRHRVFNLRAELFDCARRGEIAFDHPAYLHLRITMNGFLRFADRINLATMFLCSMRLQREQLGETWEWVHAWDAARSTLEPAMREKLTSLKSRVHFELFKQLVFGSPVLMILLIPPLCVGLLQLIGKRVVSGFARSLYVATERQFERASVPIDGLAYRIGSLPAMSGRGYPRG